MRLVMKCVWLGLCLLGCGAVQHPSADSESTGAPSALADDSSEGSSGASEVDESAAESKPPERSRDEDAKRAQAAEAKARAEAEAWKTLAKVDDLALALGHGCLITAEKELYCWGDGAAYGKDSSDTPQRVDGLPPVVRVAAAESATCALSASGDLYCMGDSLLEAVRPLPETPPPGEETSDEDATDEASLGPLLIASGVGEFALSSNHVCVVGSATSGRSGLVRCAGMNDAGQLGDGTRAKADENEETRPRPLLRPVTKRGGGQLRAVARLHLQERRSCAITQSGRLLCWGSNDQGGHIFNTPSHYLRATAVPVGTPIVDVDEDCVLTRDGRQLCWGEQFKTRVSEAYTPLGTGNCETAGDRLVGADCWRSSAGILWCSRYEGDLPLPEEDGYRDQPSLVVGNDTRVVASQYSVCVIESDGAAACWRRADTCCSDTGILAHGASSRVWKTAFDRAKAAQDSEVDVASESMSAPGPNCPLE